MAWYKNGSINLEQGSKTVTGVGTKWTNPLIGICSGQMLILKTKNSLEICEIASVQSDTQLTLANEYIGDTKTGVNYEIPTSPNVSIEALALRISEMLNYYQTQLDAWQMILTSEDEVTLTAPNGQQVTIKSQHAISNELVKLLEQSKGYADLTAQNADTAVNSAKSAKTSAENAKKSAELVNQSVTDAKNLAQQSADNAIVAKTSADTAKKLADNASKSATDAKNAALSIDTSNFIQSTGAERQSIDGSLDVDRLTENDVRVYSPNNKPTADDVGALPVVKTNVNNVSIYTVGSHVVFTDFIGDQRLMPFRRNELPFGWYFRNGDNFLLSSPQGQALNRLSTNYKNDHRITIKTVNGQQYINVPTAFASDGRGCFERPVDGAARQVGHIEGDTIRNINARFGNFLTSARDASGAFRVESTANPAYDGNAHGWHTTISFDASRVVPTANENRPINIGMTPVIYLGV